MPYMKDNWLYGKYTCNHFGVYTSVFFTCTTVPCKIHVLTFSY